MTFMEIFPKSLCFRVTLLFLNCNYSYSGNFLIHALSVSMCLFKNVFCRKINAPLSHFFPPLNLSPHELVSFSVLLWLFFISVPVFFALVTGADYVGLSCFGPHAVCGQGQLWPSHSEHGQSRAREPLMWERQAGEIEWEENQPFGASKMIRFSTGVKVCSVSESPPCSPSMSPMFSQDISLMSGRKYLVHTSECKESIFWFFIQLQIHMSTSELLGVLFLI